MQWDNFCIANVKRDFLGPILHLNKHYHYIKEYIEPVENFINQARCNLSNNASMKRKLYRDSSVLYFVFRPKFVPEVITAGSALLMTHAKHQSSKSMNMR